MRLLMLAMVSVIGLVLSSPVPTQAQGLLSAEETAWLRQHANPLRVHNEQSWKPYNYFEDGQAKGYSIDYIKLVAEKLGIEVKFVSGPSWSEFLEMVKDGSLDLMLNIANTKDRRTYLAFTEPYHITSTSLFVRNSEQDISDLNDLAGKRIGFTRGFFFEEFIRRFYPEIEVVLFDSTLESLIGVKNGLADAAMEVPEVARGIMLDAGVTGLKHVGTVKDPLFIPTFSMATRKDAARMRDIIQKAMDAVTSTERRALLAKWNLDNTGAPNIPAEDAAYLKQLGELRICVNPDRLPLEAVNIDGTLTGVSSEFVKLLADRLTIPLRLVETENWADSLRYAKTGRCDLLPMTINTEALAADLDFTSPWLSLQNVVATRNDQIYISDFKQVTNRKVGVVKGLGVRDILLKAYPGIRLQEVESVAKGLAKVENGSLFGFIDSVPTITRAIQGGNLTRVKISGEIGLNINLAVGVAKGDDKLLPIVERAIADIDKRQIAAIYNRWIAVTYVDRVDYTMLWLLLAAVTIITFYVYHRYRQGVKTATELRTAHAKVEAANRELDEKNQELDRQSLTDPLTGLSNRRMIDKALHDEFIRFKRYDISLSVILVDIDHFKQVNDDHGHIVGDRVLKSVAEILTANTRGNDLVGRWGGEEFIVICPSTALEGSVKLAEILKYSLKEQVPDGLPGVTASFGVAHLQPVETVESLIKRADGALFDAKSKGRDRVSTGEHCDD